MQRPEHINAQLYTIASQTWTELRVQSGDSDGRLPEERKLFGAAVVAGADGGERIILAGGQSDSAASLADVWSLTILDAGSLLATSRAPLRYGRVGHSLTLLPDTDQLVLVGGTTDGPSGEFSLLAPATWLYNATADTWSEGPDLEVPRVQHSAVAVSGQLLVWGGALSQVRPWRPLQPLNMARK